VDAALIEKLRRVVLPEYPLAFFAEDGAGCLDMLHILAVPGTAVHSAFLGQIKCSTKVAKVAPLPSR
jgi:hypothetical protein